MCGEHVTPRTAAQFEIVRADARERIERAALRVFARRGYATATVRDVAREAGVAQGLLYNYFAGKQQLLVAIARRGLADVAASFAAAEVDAPPVERLERLVRAAFAIVREHLDFWQLLYGVRQQPEALASLADEIRAWNDGIVATLDAHLAAVGRADPALDARLLFAAIDGVAQHFALDPERYPLDRVADRVVATFCAPGPPTRPSAGPPPSRS